MFYTLIGIVVVNSYLLSSYAAVPKKDKFTMYLAFREALYKALFIHTTGAETARAVCEIATASTEHQRGPLPKRSACVICKQDAVEGRRGIRGQQRRILHALSPNIVSRSLDRYISRPRTGCVSCGVALCTTGGCWSAFHSVVEANNGG